MLSFRRLCLKYAVSRPRVGGLLCRRVAQTYHECEWLARVWSLRLAGVALPKNARAPPLRDQAAVNLGGELLAHLNYCSKKLEKKSEWLALMLSLEEIQHEINLQQADMDRLHTALLALEPAQLAAK